MNDQQQMDPSELGERLHRAFGAEPPHDPVAADLARGRRRLRRHRASVALGGLAVATVVSGAALAVPGVLPGATDVGPAAGGQMSDRTIVATCMRKENVLHLDARGRSVSEEAALRLLGEPRLVTTAATDLRTEATLLSDDGRFWGRCQFANRPEAGVKNAMGVFATDVGRGAEPAGNAAHDQVVATHEGDGEEAPQLEVPCLGYLSDGDRAAADARCPEFTMYWNDRRPAEVAAVRIVTPDGVSTWADVRRGYLSFAYTGDMTPRLAAQVARGDAPGARRVVFYDEAGEVLVDDRDPGQVPADGGLSILDFPSLARRLP